MLALTSLHKHSRKNTRRKSIKVLILDGVVDLAVILAPLSLLPQLYEVWTDSSAGVSLATWLLTLLITLPLIAYDITHKVAKLAVMHVSIVIISFGIVMGVLLS